MNLLAQNSSFLKTNNIRSLQSSEILKTNNIRRVEIPYFENRDIFGIGKFVFFTEGKSKVWLLW